VRGRGGAWFLLRPSRDIAHPPCFCKGIGLFLLVWKRLRRRHNSPISASLPLLALFLRGHSWAQVRLKMGEAFVDCSSDHATEFCEKKQVCGPVPRGRKAFFS
jgi:hypothetical protein